MIAADILITDYSAIAFDYSILSIHRTNNQYELAELYSAADVFVNPTREETLAAEETVAYEPVFFWKQIKHGANFILAHVLTGWRALTQRMVTGV